MAILEIEATPEQVDMVSEMYALTGAALKAAVSADVIEMLKTKWYVFNRKNMKKNMKKFGVNEEE